MDDTTEPKNPDVIEENERETPDYWRRWIKAAERAAQPFREKAKAAWTEYQNDKPEVVLPYPIYGSSCKTLEPAYYAKTPKITTRRRFDIKDEIALTGSLIAERLGQYLVDCVEFDAVMFACVQDFIHADKTAPQIRYEEESREVEQQVPLTPTDTGYLGPEGEEWLEEVFQDDTGFYGVQIAKEIVTQRICLGALPYDEVLHTPDAKCESEITEKAYHFCLSKEDAKRRFGDKANSIQWENKKNQGTKDAASEWQRDAVESVGEYVEGWEIWDKTTKRVHWLTDQYQEGFLDSKDDMYQLKEFFPSPPFIIGSKPSKSMWPTPAHHHLKPLITDLHKSADKFHELLSGVERRALVNSADEEFLLALNSRGHGTFVSAPNLTNIVEKAGVESLIYWIPVQELVQAMGELSNVQEKFKNEFYEWFGVPDILRGATEPLESASAQQLKAEAAHDRFKWNKKLVAQMARDTIEMMVDLALGVFDDDKIAECTGYEFMTPEDQQRFPAALAMLRDDKSRTIRIEIDSDSMSFVDEQLRAQQVNNAVNTVTNGLKQISEMLQVSPQAGAIGLQALLLTLDTMPAGKEFHDSIKQTAEALIEQAKNPPEPGPPPPDYDMLKIQVEQQKLQAQAMRDQMEAQAMMREADRKDYELQLKAGKESAEMQLKQYAAQLEQVVQQFMMELESQRVQIEQFKAQMQARESEMEEIRLARETELTAYQAAVDTARSETPESVTPPVVNIINTQAPTPPAATILPVLPEL